MAEGFPCCELAARVAVVTGFLAVHTFGQRKPLYFGAVRYC